MTRRRARRDGNAESPAPGVRRARQARSPAILTLRSPGRRGDCESRQSPHGGRSPSPFPPRPTPDRTPCRCHPGARSAGRDLAVRTGEEGGAAGGWPAAPIRERRAPRPRGRGNRRSPIPPSSAARRAASRAPLSGRATMPVRQHRAGIRHTMFLRVGGAAGSNGFRAISVAMPQTDPLAQVPGIAGCITGRPARQEVQHRQGFDASAHFPGHCPCRCSPSGLRRPLRSGSLRLP